MWAQWVFEWPKVRKNRKNSKKPKMLIFDWKAQKTCFGHVWSKKCIFYHRGDPYIDFFRKNRNFPKFTKTCFFVSPALKKCFWAVFTDLDINNREKLFKRVINDYFYIDCVSREARPVRAKRGERLILLIGTMLEQGLDAQRLQKHHFLLYIKLVPCP